MLHGFINLSKLTELTKDYFKMNSLSLSLILLELESYIRTERSRRYHLWFSLCVKKYGGHTSMWPQGGQMMRLMLASDLRNWEARCPSLRHMRGSDAMCLFGQLILWLCWEVWTVTLSQVGPLSCVCHVQAYFTLWSLLSTTRRREGH